MLAARLTVCFLFVRYQQSDASATTFSSPYWYTVFCRRRLKQLLLWVTLGSKQQLRYVCCHCLVSLSYKLGSTQVDGLI